MAKRHRNPPGTILLDKYPKWAKALEGVSVPPMRKLFFCAAGQKHFSGHYVHHS